MTENAIAPLSPNALATANRTDFTPEQVGLIKRTIAAGATDDELALFLRQCRRTGLDPFARQIYCVKRQGKMTIQVGIDGFRLIADRSAQYAGNDDPVFDNEEKPRKATVTVYKIVGGVRCDFTATARWDQYYPGDSQGFMWKKMPHLMLGKCAEALALRKAFPAELSGLYITEEMQQAGPVDNEQTIQPRSAPQLVTSADTPHNMPVLLSEEQVEEINGLIQDLREEGVNFNHKSFMGWVQTMPGCGPHVTELPHVPASCHERIVVDLKQKLEAFRAKAKGGKK